MGPSAFLISTFPQYFTIAFPLPNRYNKSSIVEGRLQMKKRGKKKWIGIIATAVMVLAVAAVFAWKHLGDREPEVPELVAIPIDEEHFPDKSFRLYVSLNYDVNEDGVLSGFERRRVTECEVSGMGIEDLKGIEFFPKLRSLVCDDNQLRSLDVSQNPELRKLNCYSNDIKSLVLGSKPELQLLFCYGNDLKSLDVSQCPELGALECSSNELKSLDVRGNTKLQSLDCGSNRLESLDVSGLSDLGSLHCESNRMTSLNVTGCGELDYILCEDNALTSLDLSTCDADIYVRFDGNPMTDGDILYNPLQED